MGQKEAQSRMTVRLSDIFAGLMALSIVSTPALSQAQSLQDTLTALVKTHKRMLAANADVRAANQQLEVTWGDWYPNLSVTANIGPALPPYHAVTHRTLPAWVTTTGLNSSFRDL